MQMMVISKWIDHCYRTLGEYKNGHLLFVFHFIPRSLVFEVCLTLEQNRVCGVVFVLHDWSFGF